VELKLFDMIGWPPTIDRHWNQGGGCTPLYIHPVLCKSL